MFCTADKGSNWVILDPQHYSSEGLRQLSDNNFYAPLNNTKSTRNMKAINHLILYMYQKKFIILTEKRFLLATSDFNSRSFYLLPKIHKIHFSIPNTQPKCRPIVNCKFCE